VDQRGSTGDYVVKGKLAGANAHVDTNQWAGATFRFLQTNDTDGTIVYERILGDVRLVFAINNHPKKASVDIPAPQEDTKEIILSEGEWNYMEAGNPMTAPVEVGPYDFRIFENTI